MLHHYILRPQADQLRAVGLLFDDGLHDELPKGSALNAVNTEGYRNDEFKAKVKQMCQMAPDAGESMQKLALLGALTLYLDFINLFL